MNKRIWTTRSNHMPWGHHIHLCQFCYSLVHSRLPNMPTLYYSMLHQLRIWNQTHWHWIFSHWKKKHSMKMLNKLSADYGSIFSIKTRTLTERVTSGRPKMFENYYVDWFLNPDRFWCCRKSERKMVIVGMSVLSNDFIQKSKK